MEENAWIWNGHNYFLDGTVHLNDPSIANHVQFTSFPRSGNSFLRRLIENVTGIETGSCMPAELTALMPIIGMKGESNKDDKIWVCKSHYPLVAPLDLKTPPFFANKTFMVVRNPFDVINSYTQLLNTFTHDAVVEFDYLRDHPEWWHKWVKMTTLKIKWFFDTIWRQFIDEKQNPIYFVRYEDLVLNKKDTLMGLFSFILGKKDLKGTNIERRIDKIVSMGLAGSKSYALKSTTGKFNIHIKKYPPELRQFIQETLRELSYRFGYANVNLDDESPAIIELKKNREGIKDKITPETAFFEHK